MTYTEKHLDQIDASLSRPGRNGDVPRLSQQISDDAQLKEAAKDVEMLWQATRLERLQGKLTMLKEYEKQAKAEAEAKEDKKAKVISMGKMRLILSVAAGVLLMVAVGWFVFKSEPPAMIQNQYLAAHFDDYILYDVMMGETTTKATKEQERAYNLFAIRDFDNAMPLLKKEWEENGDQLSLFYLITIELGTGNRSVGDQIFQKNRDALTPQQQRMIERLID